MFTATESHLVRVPMATLEERWAKAGFVRIHRSYLVSLTHVQEVRFAPGRASVVVGADELPVSRRHTRALRDLLAARVLRA
jgi:DNA-binding LytR/AlgR family response regulator